MPARRSSWRPRMQLRSPFSATYRRSRTAMISRRRTLGTSRSAEVSALSVGSGPPFAIGKIELVSTQRAHQQDRAIDAELRRLYDSYITNAPTSNTPPIRETRFNYFGHTTAYADNKQGECAWNVFPNPSPRLPR